jgi:type VI secretion system protein ImpM
VSSSIVSRSVGYFGKVPQLGDFVSSNLPRTFVEPWDAFLRDMLSSSREALGDDWLEAYINGPIWRFLLGARVAGPTPVIGTLMPSVDRVGRYFPLTIAALGGTPAAAGVDPWFEKAETLSLETLDDAFDPATLSARVQELGAPPSDSVAPIEVGSWWWTLGSRSLSPIGFRSAALPQGAAGATLLDGDWQRWGWSVQPIPFDPELKETVPS